MIGNDIVDLAQAKRDSNWRRRGFLEKVFTAHEQQLVYKAGDPDQMVWLLWSMKESAYKLMVRQTQKRTFAPKKIVCSLNEFTNTTSTGTVVYEEKYQTRSLLTPNYIATSALSSSVRWADCTQTIVTFPDPTYQTQHRSLREHIQQQNAVRFGVSEQAIQIQKNKIGAPELIVANSLSIPISISHHGFYGAYVIGL